MSNSGDWKGHGHDFYLTFDASRSRFVVVPLGWRVAQAVDTGKSTGPSSAAGGDKSAGAKNDGAARRAPSRATRRKLMFLAA